MSAIQLYCSKVCKRREGLRRFRAKHKADNPPPGKPPGRARFRRTKLNPNEAVLNFPAPQESTPGSKQASAA